MSLGLSRRVLLVAALLLGTLIIYTQATITNLSQSTTQGLNTIVRTESAFFTDKITNNTPFPITIRKIAFAGLPYNAIMSEELYVWTGAGPYGGVQYEVPESFTLVGQKPLRLRPGEKMVFGFILTSIDGKAFTADGLQLHCRLFDIIPLRITSGAICRIDPDPPN